MRLGKFVSVRSATSAAAAIALASLASIGLTASPALASSIGPGYELYSVSAGVNANCDAPFSFYLGTLSVSPPFMWGGVTTDVESDGDLVTVTGYQEGFSTELKYEECNASTAETFRYVYYGGNQVSRKYIEVLECMGNGNCDPISGPIYYGWGNGWPS
jgi:hypothetical protein